MTPKVGNFAYKGHTKQTKGIDTVKRVIFVIVNPNAIASNHAVMIHPKHASNHVLDIKLLNFSNLLTDYKSCNDELWEACNNYTFYSTCECCLP